MCSQDFKHFQLSLRYLLDFAHFDKSLISIHLISHFLTGVSSVHKKLELLSSLTDSPYYTPLAGVLCIPRTSHLVTGV